VHSITKQETLREELGVDRRALNIQL